MKPEFVSEPVQFDPVEPMAAESKAGILSTCDKDSKDNTSSEENNSQPNTTLPPQITLQQENSESLPSENPKNISDSLLDNTQTSNFSTDMTETCNTRKNKNVENTVYNVNKSVESVEKTKDHKTDIILNETKLANTALPDLKNDSPLSEKKQGNGAFGLGGVSLGEVVEITVRPANNNSFKEDDFIQEQHKIPDFIPSKTKTEKIQKPVKHKKEKKQKGQFEEKSNTEADTAEPVLTTKSSKSKTIKSKTDKEKNGAGKHLEGKTTTPKNNKSKSINNKTTIALLILLLCIAVAIIIVILNRQTSYNPSTNSSESVSPTYTVTESSTEPIETTFETAYEITITETPETPDASIPVESPGETEPAAEETDTPVETAAPTQTTAPTTAPTTATTTTTAPQRPVATQTPTAATPTTTVEPTASPSPSPSTSPSPSPTVTPTSTPTPTPTATPTNEFYVSRSSVTVSVGSSFTVTANTECSWLTSDPTIATVSDGRITGVSAGTCIITAYRSLDGTTATITVTVK